MSSSTSFTNGLSVLTVDELRSAARGLISIPRHIANRKLDIIEYLVGVADEDFIEKLKDLSLEKQQSKIEDRNANTSGRKRMLMEYTRERRVRQRVEKNRDVVPGNETFMELPDQNQVEDCYRDFYKATGSQALAMAICGVCGREVDCQDNPVVTLALDQIPNGTRLIPQKPHPAHELFSGMLLEPQGVVNSHLGDQVNVCRECLKELDHDKNTPPPFSLANNLWVGRIPWELERLTFSEQLLIAQLYPRVYVFKLYPKTMDRHMDASTLQRGLRGNVSTFALDSQGMASMITGNLMPRPPAILASVISVTFIGYGKLPTKFLRGLFGVRRHVVLEALLWLKTNNPKYYGDIIIDTNLVDNLPEDDVPEEVLSIIRQSNDVDVIDEERAGYVYNEEALEGKLDDLRIFDKD